MGDPARAGLYFAVPGDSLEKQYFSPLEPRRIRHAMEDDDDEAGDLIASELRLLLPEGWREALTAGEAVILVATAKTDADAINVLTEMLIKSIATAMFATIGMQIVVPIIAFVAADDPATETRNLADSAEGAREEPGAAAWEQDLLDHEPEETATVLDPQTIGKDLTPEEKAKARKDPVLRTLLGDDDDDSAGSSARIVPPPVGPAGGAAASI